MHCFVGENAQVQGKQGWYEVKVDTCFKFVKCFRTHDLNQYESITKLIVLRVDFCLLNFRFVFFDLPIEFEKSQLQTHIHIYIYIIYIQRFIYNNELITSVLGTLFPDVLLLPRKGLIDHFCAELSETDRETMLQRLLSTGRTKAQTCKTQVLHEVMEVLQGDGEEEQFRDLQDEVDDKWRHSFIIERMGHSKEAASVITPEPIKKLRPPVAAVLLVWQISQFAFEAYYPLAGVEPEKKLQKRGKKATRRKTHTSTSASYKTKRTQFQALWHCVNFLWSRYKKDGGDS